SPAPAMPLLALGLNHQTAPLALREKVSLEGGRLPAALEALKQLPGVQEAALLSTCNRTEIYAQVAEGQEAGLLDWLARHNGLGAEALAAYVYEHREEEAVRHLFRVATGLDLLVLCEPQILCEVKYAWQAAREYKTLRTPLDRLLLQSF